MKTSTGLKDYLSTLFAFAAQYDRPPRYPVTVVCKGIDGGANGIDILGRIFSGMVAYNKEDKKCFDLDAFFSEDSLSGWDWQVIHIHLSIFFF